MTHTEFKGKGKDVERLATKLKKAQARIFITGCDAKSVLSGRHSFVSEGWGGSLHLSRYI